MPVTRTRVALAAALLPLLALTAYSVLRYTFPRGSPFQGLSAGDTGPGLFGGQNQPVPPENQTVSLTC